MEIILLIIIIRVVWGLILSFLKNSSSSSPSSQDSSNSSRRSHSFHSAKRDPNVYRPRKGISNSPKSSVIFKNCNSDFKNINDADIKDLVDALTGAPLQLSSNLYQCTQCRVFYQFHSIEVIQTENGGRCVSCLSKSIVVVTGDSERRGRNAEVSAITLENYHKYVGHIITFKGEVKKVLTSRRGKDYAVMFENLSWTRGFKMVVFKGAVDRMGGYRFLSSLVGRDVRVRGLLIDHDQFGYEIVVSDRAMILDIK